MGSFRSLFMGFDALVVPSESISTNAQYVAFALEILDEVHQSNAANPLEDLLGPWKRLQSQIIFRDCSLFLIG
jgi:hypothetical protein